MRSCEEVRYRRLYFHLAPQHWYYDFFLDPDSFRSGSAFEKNWSRKNANIKEFSETSTTFIRCIFSIKWIRGSGSVLK